MQDRLWKNFFIETPPRLGGALAHLLRKAPNGGLVHGGPKPLNALPATTLALTTGLEMESLFDQLRITLMGFLCGGGLMAIALFLAGVVRP